MELKKCKRFYTEIVGNEKNNQKATGKQQESNRKATGKQQESNVLFPVYAGGICPYNGDMAERQNSMK